MWSARAKMYLVLFIRQNLTSIHSLVSCTFIWHATSMNTHTCIYSHCWLRKTDSHTVIEISCRRISFSLCVFHTILLCLCNKTSSAYWWQWRQRRQWLPMNFSFSNCKEYLINKTQLLCKKLSSIAQKWTV